MIPLYRQLYYVMSNDSCPSHPLKSGGQISAIVAWTSFNNALRPLRGHDSISFQDLTFCFSQIGMRASVNSNLYLQAAGALFDGSQTR